MTYKGVVFIEIPVFFSRGKHLSKPLQKIGMSNENKTHLWVLLEVKKMEIRLSLDILLLIILMFCL